MQCCHTFRSQVSLKPFLVFALIASQQLRANPESSLEKQFDKVWGLSTLYSNDNNTIIQELKLQGRYHGQYHWSENKDTHVNDWEDRRIRLGVNTQLFSRKIEIKVDAQGSDTFEPVYKELADAYIKWSPHSSLSITAGRQKVKLAGYEFQQSSNVYPAFERTQLFNQLRLDRATGLSAEYSRDKLTVQSGIYSNDVDREFGQFGGSVAVGIGAQYDLSDSFQLNKAELRLDYLYSDITQGSTTLNRYEHLSSFGLWIENPKWSFATEVFYGKNKTLEIFGFMLMPTYDLIPETLQAVTRYSFSKGNKINSIFPQSRYETSVGAQSGEQYQSAYLGLQYFIYGDKFKLMGGTEYAELVGGDYQGWTALLGSRLYF